MLTTSSPSVRGYRIGIAALDLAAIVYTLLRGAGSPTFSVANYFSYFTIQSNLLAIVVLAGCAIAGRRAPAWDHWRGAATLFMLITGVVYAVLLHGVSVGLTAGWVNNVLHRLVPLVMVLDWLLVPAGLRTDRSSVISPRAALAWLAYPLCYFGYSLIRGPVVRFYPYPFLDPRHHGGYGRVVIYAVVLAAVMGVLALMVRALGELRARRVSRISS